MSCVRLTGHDLIAMKDPTHKATVPIVSFDLCTTKALGEDDAEAQVSSSLWLILGRKAKSNYIATTEIMGSTKSVGPRPTNKEWCGIDRISFHGYFVSRTQFLQSLGFNFRDQVRQEICTLPEANGA